MSSKDALKTHCPKGHLYDEQNTIIEEYNGKKCRRCRMCKNERSKLYQAKHMDKVIEKNRCYRKAYPNKIKMYDHKSTVLKRGLTLENYNQIKESQNGVCAICGKVCSTGKNLAIDHDHLTGKIRGLLCGNCNRGLGMFKDSVETLEKAIYYLNFHKCSEN